MSRPSRAPATTIGLLLVLTALASAQTLVLPPDGFAPGWVKAEKPGLFKKVDLFNYVDGGAELFLEFGFDTLVVQGYIKDFMELTLEVYQMESPESALGVYLLKSGKETPVKGLSARNTGDKFQITALRDRWFIHVNNPDGLPDAVPAMTVLAQKLAAALPEGPRVTLLDALPASGIIKGSERLFRGPYALQSLYTLGPTDILQQNRTIFGIAADYMTEKGEYYTRILVPYPDSAAAKEAFRYLVQNLDSYLEVVDSYGQGFIFHDFQNKYGQAELKGTWIEVLVNLTTKPDY
jgi:hypothetical protein